MTDLDQKAIAIAQKIADLWNNYSDENSVETDLAMREAAKEAVALDLSMVEGVIASPLKYYAMVELEDHNPEDLTFCEMVESLEISIGILTK